MGQWIIAGKDISCSRYWREELRGFRSARFGSGVGFEVEEWVDGKGG